MCFSYLLMTFIDLSSCSSSPCFLLCFLVYEEKWKTSFLLCYWICLSSIKWWACNNWGLYCYWLHIWLFVSCSVNIFGCHKLVLFNSSDYSASCISFLNSVALSAFCNIRHPWDHKCTGHLLLQVWYTSLLMILVH